MTMRRNPCLQIEIVFNYGLLQNIRIFNNDMIERSCLHTHYEFHEWLFREMNRYNYIRNWFTKVVIK
jgi:hypothetical protein